MKLKRAGSKEAWFWPLERACGVTVSWGMWRVELDSFPAGLVGRVRRDDMPRGTDVSKLHLHLRFAWPAQFPPKGRGRARAVRA